MRLLRLGLTKVGSKLQADGSFFSANWDAGQVLWGPLPDQVSPMEKLEETVFEADANSHWSQFVVLDLVRKWIFSVTLNCVCAAYLLPTNGQELQLHEVLLREVFSEAWEASQRV